MAAPCRRSRSTWPLVCLLIATTTYTLITAKPLQSGEHSLSTSDVQYYTTSPDYTFVKPVRLGTRHRRSIDDADTTSTIEVTIEGVDQLFHIELMESMSLFDAGLLVKRIGADGQVRIDQPTSACYHQGRLVGQEDSTSVSLSTCNDRMVGMIRTPDVDYALKPLTNAHIDMMTSSEEEAPTHILYKVPAEEFPSITSETNRIRSIKGDETKRRDTNGPKIVETSVVADSTMFGTYGEDTEFYLFTILNQVAGLFSDSSLSADMRLKVNTITILEAPQSNLDVTDELSHSLANFCKWQKEETSDISVLLTRLDLQIGGNHAVTGKASDVGGACDPSRRCIIAEDSGPSGAIFTLAHEMGHSLGMYHDDAESGCDNNRNIMASGNSGGSEAFRWSRCSSSDLNDFLSLPDSECLDRVAEEFPSYDESSVIMPGYFYDALKQCQMTFGPQATVAEGYLDAQTMCAELQCMLPGSAEPVTNHVPVLDGTKCGAKRQICVHGQCLKVASMYDCAATGGQCVPEWLQGNYGTCQDDCYRYRNVFCVERHDDGTTVLVTDLSLCPAEVPTDREYCCDTEPNTEAQYSVEAGVCSVTCGTGVEVRTVTCRDVTTDEVVDESLCTDPRPEESVQCAPLPCPGVTYILFYSNWGQCSVTCDSGVQTRTAFCADSSGNSQALSICEAVFDNIVTTRVCSLETCDTTVDTFFYVTGDFNGTCTVTCGQGIETRSVFCLDVDGNVVDDVNCANLQRPASQRICNAGTCPNIYTYVTTSYSTCSEPCGPGIQTRSVFCLNEANELVSEDLCLDQGLTRPPTTQACQIQSCVITYQYIAPDFPECTATCGTQVFTRDVSCVSSEGNLVDNSFCVDAGLDPLDTIFVCDLEPCGLYEFVVGEFSSCSATCDVGVQTRSVICVDLNNNNNIVSNSLCPGETPVSAMVCNLGDCPSEYNYLTSSFSACDCEGVQTRIVVCVTYSNGAPVPAVDLECLNAGLEKPATAQNCTVPPSCTPVWRVGDFSECSVTCGSGIRTRDVFCLESEGSDILVDDSLCNQEERPSAVEVCDLDPCAVYSFIASNFGDCSVTCGEGVRQRDVFCYRVAGGDFEIVDSSLCNPAEEPPSEEFCLLDPCGGVYEATAWSECSVTCAAGVQSRDVACVTFKGSGVELDEEECANMTRPQDERECYLAPCPPPYGCDQEYPMEGSTLYSLQSPGYPSTYPHDLECSKFLLAPNGSNVEITFTDFLLEAGCPYDRLMLIDVETNSVTRLCDTVELPYVYESSGNTVEVRFITDGTVAERGFTGTYRAVLEDGPEYVAGEWEECSVTCGEGVESRVISCEQDGRPVSDSLCAGLPVPPSMRPCQGPPCPPVDACGENILRLEAGSINSPGFPESYPPNVTCTNTLRAPLGQVLVISVSFFSTDRNSPCNESDRVVIQDSSDDADAVTLCGSVAAGVVFTSLTNEVTVTFISDETPVTASGFVLDFEFTDPERDICGDDVSVSGQPIYSPGYPDNYGNNEICITTITSEDDCIALQFLFMDINNGDNDGDDVCRDDVLQIEDSNNPSLRRTYCANDAPSEPWLSASGDVRVTFASNQFNSSQGYIAIPRFVDCPPALWVPLPFGNCSAACGEGNRTRELECRSALTSEIVDPSECPEERPVTFEPCTAEPCPSCDAQVTDGNVVYEFPFAADAYDYNDECTLTITNEEGCVRLFALNLDINESPGDRCGRDSLRLYDPENVYANAPFCGSVPPAVRYQSLGNTVQVTLRAVDSPRYKSVEIYPSFGACPTHAYKPGPWTTCSESCGGGTRARDVPCVNLQTEEETDASLCEDADAYPLEEECNTQDCPVCYEEITSSGVVVSPGFGTEEGYENNLDCLYEIENPTTDECITVSFNSFDLGDPEDMLGGRCADIVEIIDEAGNMDQHYCAVPDNATLPVFFSRSSSVQLIFRTDAEGQNDGFEALVDFASCPEFGFVAGNFSECSVTCGGGFRTRDVECVRFSNGMVVDDAICQDPRPRDMMPCSRERCPSCDQVITEEGLFSSPNSPDVYDNNMECEYTLVSSEGCGRITFLSRFELGPNAEDCEDGDYIEIEDEGWEYLDATYCGNTLPPVWRSRTNTSTLTFVSDEEDSYRGFTAFFSFVDCPRFGFLVGEYGECDVTCGEGVQQRSVTCSDLDSGEEVDDSMCTDPRPPQVQECQRDPCPSCDETFTEDASSLTRSAYDANQVCVYNITAPEDQCVRVTRIQWELTPANEDGECEGDRFTVEDNYIEETFCGSYDDAPISKTYYESTVFVTFESDDVDQPGDLSLFFRFVDCPEFVFIAGEYEECSATCGGGVRTRDVNCTRLATGEVVSEDNCNPMDRPEASESCNEDACPACYELITEAGTIEMDGYSSNERCIYNVTAPADRCINIVVLDWNLLPGPIGLEQACVGDSLTFTDSNYPYRVASVCGTYMVGFPFVITTYGSEGLIEFVSDEDVNHVSFEISVSFGSCPEYGYVVGEFGQCSATCGGGVRTRDVNCTRLATGEVVSEGNCNPLDRPADSESCNEDACPICFEYISETGQYITSPNYPSNYNSSQMCTYFIQAPPDMCVNVFLTEMDIQEPLYFDSCFTSDFLTFNEAIDQEYSIDQVLCGTGENIQWTSSSPVAVLYFSTDAAITGSGFRIYSSFVDCLRYSYDVGNFSECSATCGPGQRQREVYCVDRQNNNTVVSDDLCDQDVRPVDTVFCYLEDCIYCDIYVNETQLVESVGYPDELPGGLTCNANLYNPEPAGCWNITVLDFEDGEDNDDGECNTGFSIEDNVYATDKVYLCEEEDSFLSISNNLLVQYFSEADELASHYRIFFETVPCPEYAFVPLNFGECSVTCGEGVQTREVQCLNLQSGEVVGDRNCAGPRPPRSRECELDECPSCDQYFNLTSGQAIINSPNSPADYDNNQECSIVVEASGGSCIAFSVAFLDLEPPSNVSGCWESDRLEVVDVLLRNPRGMALDQVYCGNYGAFDWTSSGSASILRFISNAENTFPGYVLIATPEACTQYSYGTTEFSECSVTCGPGLRTREVLCYDALANYTAVADNLCSSDVRPIDTIPCIERECMDFSRYINESTRVASPNFMEDDYFPNLNYTLELYNPEEGGCWQIEFDNFQLQNRTREGYCNDRLEIEDGGISSLNVSASFVLCGDTVPAPYTSLSNSVRVTFISDEEEEELGFRAEFTTVACEAVGYSASQYSECSVTCGTGLQTRDVSCVNLTTGEPVDEGLCSGLRPQERLTCYRGICPSCDQVINETTTIYSPNYPANYDNNQRCELTFEAPPESCFSVTLSLNLEEPDQYFGCMATDAISIYDPTDSPPFFTLSHVLCGEQENVTHVFPSNDYAKIIFTTNSEDTFAGYQISATVVDCPVFAYQPQAFGACSVTCGYGVQQREIDCVNQTSGQTVRPELCEGLLYPLDTMICNDGECPSCDAFVNVTNALTRTGNTYPLFQECEYEYENPEGGCLSFVFTIVNLPPADEDGECERDYLEYEEEGEYSRELKICGNSATAIVSRSSTASLNFRSDGFTDYNDMDMLYSGFTLFTGFVSCPEYGFIADEDFGECDVTCGGGVETRNVSCIDLSNGTLADDSLCLDTKPADVRPCNTQPCPNCDAYINETNIVISNFNESAEYRANLNCLYTLDIADGCVEIFISRFELGDDCEDYVQIRDLAPLSEGIEERFCDDEALNMTWRSRSGQVEVLFASDEDSEGDSGFTLRVNPIACPDYGFVYGNFSECSATCGEAVRTRDVYCVQLDNGIPGNRTGDALCQDEQPDATEECELEDCPSCDRNFTVSGAPQIIESANPYQRLAECVDTVTTDEGSCLILTILRLDMENSVNCTNDAITLADPFDERASLTACGMPSSAIPPFYSSGNELTITLRSDAGIEGAGYMVVAASNVCPNLTWVVEDVGECSRTCGGGVQQRNVYCVNQVDDMIFAQEESCPEGRPEDTLPCNPQNCPQECGLVFTNEETQELLSPGYPEHLYENDIDCANIIINFAGCIAITIQEIDIEPSANCTKDYLSIRDNNRPSSPLILCGNELPANNLWVSSAITPTTVGLVTDSANRYPGYNLTFEFVPCPRQGFTVGAYGACSVMCGTGVVTREVSCEDSNGNSLPDVSCWGQRPLAEQPCYMDPCQLDYETGEWSPCSATCGDMAVQTRTVECVADNVTVVNASLCESEGLARPDEQRACNLSACPVYSYDVGNWTECSATCGDIAVQSRTVECVADNVRMVTASFCDGAGLARPDEQRACNLSACPVYSYDVGNWTECSATCGDMAVQTRTVECVADNVTAVNASLCDGEGLARPDEQRACNESACPVYSYEVGNWTECSKSCANGTQTRDVDCVDDEGNVVASNLCDAANLTASSSIQFCNVDDCPIQDCNFTISGSAVLSGNLSSPNYPAGSPSNLYCQATFSPPMGYFLSITFDVYELTDCTEKITFNGDKTGEQEICSGQFSPPIQSSFVGDTTITMTYETDGNDMNAPRYSGQWDFIQQP